MVDEVAPPPVGCGLREDTLYAYFRRAGTNDKRNQAQARLRRGARAGLPGRAQARLAPGARLPRAIRPCAE